VNTATFYHEQQNLAIRKAKKERVKTGLAVALLIASIAAWAVTLWVEKANEKPIWTEEYPMANAGITWGGAGFDGMWSDDDGAR